MKKLFFLVTVALFSINENMAQSQTTEKEAVKNVVQSAYIDGLQNEGDKEKIEAGFHPDFYLLGIDKDDKMWRYAIKDWKAKAVEQRLKGELPLKGDKHVTANYKSIDITGNSAVVKLEYLVGGKRIYTDYLSLYKFDSGWKIVSKIFYKH